MKKVILIVLIGIIGLVHSATSVPNLNAHTGLAGWEDNIVVSKVTGTHADDLLTSTDTLYVDYVYWNNGTSPTTVRFYIELYIDGVLKQTWYADPPMNPAVAWGAVDYSIGTLATGMHTIKIKVDSTDVITELYEDDNEDTKIIFVGLPDLKLYKPSTWSDKIVISRTTGTTTDDGLLTPRETLYVDWAVDNEGAVATEMPFYIGLYVDNIFREEWAINPPLNNGSAINISDYSVGKLSPGLHTIKIVADYTDAIMEMEEAENEYVKTISISQPENIEFFRIEGEANSEITDFDVGVGMLTWSNALPNVTSMVQRAYTLVGTSNWMDYAQVATTSLVTTSKIIDLNPPEGMVFIPSRGIPGSYGFFMDSTEITKTHWDEVYNWATNHSYTFTKAGSGKRPNHPVQFVTWYDCVKWCNARSEMEGRTPCYTVSDTVYRTGAFGRGSDVVNCDFEGNGYRLPTTAEWLHAKHGGQNDWRFPWGDTIDHPNANYSANNYYFYDTSPYRIDTYHPTYKVEDLPYTSPVGSFAANGFGLYDMLGNVWEWCWDATGDDRDCWGGCYANDAYELNIGIWHSPDYWSRTIGFRTICR